MNTLLVLIGHLLPIRMTSRLYLAQALRRYGVDLDRIPPPCIQALADKSVDLTKTIALMERKPWRHRVVSDLDGMAGNVSNLMLRKVPYDRASRRPTLMNCGTC